MNTTTTTKFRFDNVFDVDASGHIREVDETLPQFTDDDLNAARAEGWQQGFEAGQQQAQNAIAAAIAANLQTVGAALQQIDVQHRQALLRIEADAADLAQTIAAKLAPELIRREPLAEITALVSHCLAAMPNEPRLVVRVAEDLVDEVSQHIDDVVARSGFTGKIALIGEPALQRSDCRVEWADGGAERDIQKLNSDVEDAVRRYRASHEDDVRRLDEASHVPASHGTAPAAEAEMPEPAPTFPEQPDETQGAEPRDGDLPSLAHRMAAPRAMAGNAPGIPDAESES